jgi:hypothetical protein
VFSTGAGVGTGGTGVAAGVGVEHAVKIIPAAANKETAGIHLRLPIMF